MTLKSDLDTRVAEIFREQWTKRDGTVVPTDTSVTLKNDAVKLDGTVLYADMADSTKLVDSMATPFSAEIYKTFLHCAAKVIAGKGGGLRDRLRMG